jgi:serine/threonine-protein kinase
MTLGDALHDEIAPGTVLSGRYRVDRVLGHGAMGMVLAATHTALKERVAIKVMLPTAVEGTEAQARFLREARAAARIKNDHVARVSDFGVLDDGSPMMVMEYLEGEDLQVILTREGPLSATRVIAHMLQVCEAVAAAHALGIVHRDLKPSNVFVTTRNGEPWLKVLDFGVSKVLAPDQDVTNVESLTRTNALLGSPLYMSPEQLLGEKVDERADVWALGVMAFELLSGAMPFTGQNIPQLIGKIVHGEARRLSDLVPDLPPALDAAIASALTKDRAARCPSVAVFAERLAAVEPSSTVNASMVDVRRAAGTSSNPPRSRNMAAPQLGETQRSPVSAVGAPPADDLGQTVVDPPRNASPASAPAPRAPQPTWVPIVIAAVVSALVAGTVVYFLRAPSAPPAPTAPR